MPLAVDLQVRGQIQQAIAEEPLSQVAGFGLTPSERILRPAWPSATGITTSTITAD